MMKKMTLFTALFCGLFPLSQVGAATTNMPKAQMIGIVDFQQCIDESKEGKEQAESLKKLEEQLSSSLTETEQAFQEIVTKAQDAEYRDSLSPEAERELMQQGQQLAQKLQEQKGQFYQILQQAEMRMIQEMKGKVTMASATVAKKHNLDLILPESATLYSKEGMNITKEVIGELNRLYQEENKADSQS